MEMMRFALTMGFLQVWVDFTCCHHRPDHEYPSVRSAMLNHSRKKRYVVFPEGSVLSVAVCLSPGVVSEAGGIFTSAIAWAISYDLPNETVYQSQVFPHQIHRNRRDVFEGLEKLMNTVGFDGRNCLLKTICESRQQIIPRQNVFEEILAEIFAYPPAKNVHWKKGTDEQYFQAHAAGQSGINCDNFFPCPISLLNFEI